jgi:hypothetical protein
MLSNDVGWIVASYFDEQNHEDVYYDDLGFLAGIRYAICELCGEFGTCEISCPCWKHRPGYDSPIGEFYSLKIDCRSCHYQQDTDCTCWIVDRLTRCSSCRRRLPFYNDQQYQVTEETPHRFCYLCPPYHMPIELLRDLTTEASCPIPTLTFTPWYRGTIIANQAEQTNWRLAREIRQELESDRQEYDDVPDLFPFDELTDEGDEMPELLEYEVEWNDEFSGMICYVDDTFNQLTGNREEGKHENKQPDQELFIKRSGDPEE